MGVDLTDPNYKGTPRRMVEVLSDFTSVLREESKVELDKHFNVLFPKHKGRKIQYKGMLVQSPIRVYSFCSHHSYIDNFQQKQFYMGPSFYFLRFNTIKLFLLDFCRSTISNCFSFLTNDSTRVTGVEPDVSINNPPASRKPAACSTNSWCTL